jgi:hypothetical protein
MKKEKLFTKHWRLVKPKDFDFKYRPASLSRRVIFQNTVIRLRPPARLTPPHERRKQEPGDHTMTDTPKSLGALLFELPAEEGQHADAALIPKELIDRAVHSYSRAHIPGLDSV